MARRRRRSNDLFNKDTLTVLGLLSMLLSFTMLIAAFVENDGTNFFAVVQSYFGQTSVLVAVFLFNLGLYLFGTRWFFTTTASIVAQGVLVVLIPAFITSYYPDRLSAQEAISLNQAGGQIGYYLAYRLFSDTLVFAQYTTAILAAAIVIFVPVALSLSPARIVEFISVILNFIAKAVGIVFVQTGKASWKAGQTLSKELPETISRYGDLAAAREEDRGRDRHDKNEKYKEIEQYDHIVPKVRVRAGDTNVEVKEAEVGDGGLSQEQLKYPDWQLPPVNLLTPFRRTKPNDTNRQRNGQIIERILQSFNVDASVVDAVTGPSVVRYAVSLPMGVNVKKVINLGENIALGLGVEASAVRIENIPGTTYMGIEVPRDQRDMVRIREIVESEANNGKAYLPLTVGKDIDGSCVVVDLAKMPHLLIAGATGSGKSVLTNSFIVSMLMNRTPDELRLILVDPKQVELQDYNGIPHLLTPVITDMSKVVNALKWAVEEMEKRYKILGEAQVRDIFGYNDKMGFAAMPYLVIVIDEMADMMMTTNRVDTETAIVRLAQKARAVGIHLILATQRPSVNVITGLIKANIPGRIGMSVTSNTDSRVIMDNVGAESLMGNGDLLFRDPKGRPTPMRLQGPFTAQEEVQRVVNFIKSQTDEVEYLSKILETPIENGPGVDGGGAGSDDDMFVQAVRIVVNYQKGSSSFLQRKLNIGFNRAARMLEEMEEMGIVGPAKGSKEREVMITDADAFFASRG
jgi:DNA segregation ATPase FtsK/SpoIIIE-like protein